MNHTTTISLPDDLAEQYQNIPRFERSKLVQRLLREEFMKVKEPAQVKTKDPRIATVYDHYCKTFKKHNSYKLTPNRERQIAARLKDAGEEMLIRAITNLSRSKWHVENNQIHLELVIRSYEQVEKMANLENPKKESLLQQEIRRRKEGEV